MAHEEQVIEVALEVGTAIDHMEVLTRMLEYGFYPASEIQSLLDHEIMVLKVPENARAFYLAGNDKVLPG